MFWLSWESKELANYVNCNQEDIKMHNVKA